MSDGKHKDPFADFGLGFKSSAERIVGERKTRREWADRQLPFHVPYLDDALRSIMPHDLIVIGARTGVGKTELVRSIAADNARTGKRVRVFALEAEIDEIERRTKYNVLVGLIAKHRPNLDGRHFNYPDWYRSRFDAALGDLDAEADEIIRERYKTLFTYYRGPKFDADDIRRLILAEHSQTDLFVLDHLHYVDFDDENENRGVREIVMTIRNVALLVGRPVILVVHLRKRERASKDLVPNTDDIHGSSDVGKVCTHVVMIDHASSVQATSKNHNNTFFSLPKDRGDGAKNLIALCPFNWRTKTYDNHYTLGRVEKGSWAPLGTSEVPYWATRHEPLSVPMEVGE